MINTVKPSGAMGMIPVTVCPKKYIDRLRREADEAKRKIAGGEQPTFETVDAMFAGMGLEKR